MVEVIALAGDREPEDDFAVMVEPESKAHPGAVEFDRRHARFIYGPRSFASQAEAIRTAEHWADQYGIERIYVH